MSNQDTIGVRRSIRELQEAYDSGNTKPLEDVVRTWKGIKKLPADDPRSIFILGYPFELRPEVAALSPTDIYAYWSGYCNHGNVLFPTWYRIYVRKLEEAL